METQFEGYPLEIFYLTALVGVILLCYRPKWAFYFIVFAMAARNFYMSVYTRTPFLGEFVNLADLFLWIGVLALIRVFLEGKKFLVPNILLAIIGINLIGIIQALFQYGFDTSVLRACWGVLIFPIMFFIAAKHGYGYPECAFFLLGFIPWISGRSSSTSVFN